MQIIYDHTRLELGRKGKNWTQIQLAKELGLTRQQVSWWESGNVVPGADNLARIATALDLLPGFFFREIEEVSCKSHGITTTICQSDQAPATG